MFGLRPPLVSCFPKSRIAVVLKLGDQFGDGRNTQVHFTAQIGNGRIAIGNIVMDDLLFQKFIAVVIIGRQ